MGTAELRELLERVRANELSVEAAAEKLRAVPAEADLGYAHVDLQRRERCGFPEVIFCEGKTSEWVEGVVRKLLEARQDYLATRVSVEQADALERHMPQEQQDREAGN